MEDSKKPLNPETIKPQIVKMSKINHTRETKPLYVKVSRKRKKHAMSLMDTMLTLVVVTPLIVGQWRGTWELMNIYEHVFPAWESFIFGASLHLCFAVVRHSLQDLIKFKTNSWIKSAFAYFLRRLYTYLFAAACIIHWRGGWIIFDEWLGIDLLPDGRVADKKVLPIVGSVFAGILIILGLLRSYRNILAAPFVIGLDTKSTAFDFPTRFQTTISYTTLHALNSKPIENTNASSVVAQKLISPHVTVEKQVLENISPRPFLNDLRGISPIGFYPNSGPTTPNYPQIQHHSSQTYPHNIQDIIQYLSDNAHRQKELLRQEQQLIKFNDESNWNYRNGGNGNPTHKPKVDNYRRPHVPAQSQYFSHDPFFAYKPQDPSDINLLAPSSFRFAPAIYSNIYKNRQKVIQEAINVINDTASEGTEALKKPISVTLNIYPYDNEYAVGNKIKFQGPGVTPRYRQPYIGSYHTRKARPGKMIVRLNIYPETNPVVFRNDEQKRNFKTTTLK